MPKSSSVTVFFPEQDESVASFVRRIESSSGDILVVLSELEHLVLADESARAVILDAVLKIQKRAHLAVRKSTLARIARAKGLRVIDSATDLQNFLKGNDALEDALREFHPQIWRQQLRSRLQRMGLLSLPRLRIWVLIGVSAALFFFVVFRLLPSATVQVWPREDTISQTANIFLAQSGAIAELPERVRLMELIPMTVRVDRTITFNQISKEFIGKNAEGTFTLFNESSETYWLKKGTRLRNQAGMTFRMQESIQIEPGDEVPVPAVAEPEDIYGEIVGARGNVPAGLSWTLPGLSREEQIYVYAKNTEETSGGETKFRTVLSQKDIDIAKKQLEEELLAIAKQLVEEKRDVFNSEHEAQVLELLYYEELTTHEFVDFVLPTQYINKPVGSVPIEGSVLYTAYSYDTQFVLELLSRELESHVGESKKLLRNTLTLDRLVAHVIDYSDDLSWIKLTVDLSGTQQYILDPLSPTGALFAQKVRETVTGLGLEEAQRIVTNYPEVQKAEVSVWPPWNRTLPSIPSHIVVEPTSS